MGENVHLKLFSGKERSGRRVAAVKGVKDSNEDEREGSSKIPV